MPKQDFSADQTGFAEDLAPAIPTTEDPAQIRAGTGYKKGYLCATLRPDRDERNSTWARGCSPSSRDRMKGRVVHSSAARLLELARRRTTRWRIGGENKVAVVGMDMEGGGG
jgi:hypothetical protein